MNSRMRTGHWQVGRTSREPSGGFTLVELLTVIAVIAVLARLLLGGLSMAMRMARNIQCRSNLRQNGVTISGFVGDHGAYPAVVDQGKLYGYPRGYIGVLEHAFGKPPSRAVCRETGSVWGCPAAVRQKLPADFPRNLKGGIGAMYAYNWGGVGQPVAAGLAPLGLGGTTVNRNGWITSPLVNESGVVSPSQMICMGDDVEGWNSVFRDGTSDLVRRPVSDFYGSTQRVKARHNGKLDTLFCDGHEAGLPLHVLFSDTSDQALSLWNRDHRPHRERLLSIQWTVAPAPESTPAFGSFHQIDVPTHRPCKPRTASPVSSGSGSWPFDESAKMHLIFQILPLEPGEG